MADAPASTKSPEDWIKLLSNDGYSFLVRRKVAVMSGTIKNMLSVDFAEGASNTCHIMERAIIVEKLCEYLQYKYTYGRVPPKEDVPNFRERIAPEIALELLTAADYFEA